MRLAQGLAELKTNGFLRSVTVLVGGTVAAHAITALALPVVTRLYTPADFSMLAVFTGLLAILSVVACLRFDVAVPMPQDDGDAVNVLALAIACTAIVSAVVALAVLSAPARLAAWLNQPDLEPYLWLLPVGVLLAGTYSALQCWFVRRKGFGSIARTRVAQSFAAATTQVGFGWLAWAPLGLLLGPTLNSGAGSAGLGYRLVQSERPLLGAIAWRRMRAMFRAYDQYPKYSTLEALSNSAGIQLPIIMIAALSVGPEAGYLILAMQVMQMPMALIGTAIGQVYLSRAPVEYRAGRLGDFTTDILGGLVKTGVGPILFVGIVSPALFALVFGEDWARAGLLVAWMTPWFIFQFLATPVSMALHVSGRQRAAFGLQLAGLVVRVSAVFGASLVALGAISEAYALSGFAFYLVYLVTVVRVVGARFLDVAGRVRSALAVLTAWLAASCVVVIVAAWLR